MAELIEAANLEPETATDQELLAVVDDTPSLVFCLTNKRHTDKQTDKQTRKKASRIEMSKNDSLARISLSLSLSLSLSIDRSSDRPIDRCMRTGWD
jgi:hypothetical protein